PTALVAVFQAPGANALAVADGAKKVMAELKQRFPSDMDYEVGLDTTLPVTEGINEIVKTLVAATILVILVVFLFLQNWRATLIPLIAVPMWLVGTFAFFPFWGSPSTRCRSSRSCLRSGSWWTTQSWSLRPWSITSRPDSHRATPRSRRCPK